MAAIRKFVLRWATDQLRVHLNGGFVAKGLYVYHPGLLLNQELVLSVVERVYTLLEKRGHRERVVRPLMERIDVRFSPPAPPAIARVDVHAAWTGGILDRGVVALRMNPGWPGALGNALLSLLLLELDPDVRAADLLADEEIKGG